MSGEALCLVIMGVAPVVFVALAWVLVPSPRRRARMAREEELRWWNDHRRSPFVGRPRRRD